MANPLFRQSHLLHILHDASVAAGTIFTTAKLTKDVVMPDSLYGREYWQCLGRNVAKCLPKAATGLPVIDIVVEAVSESSTAQAVLDTPSLYLLPEYSPQFTVRAIWYALTTLRDVGISFLDHTKNCSMADRYLYFILASMTHSHHVQNRTFLILPSGRMVLKYAGKVLAAILAANVDYDKDRDVAQLTIALARQAAQIKALEQRNAQLKEAGIRRTDQSIAPSSFEVPRDDDNQLQMCKFMTAMRSVGDPEGQYTDIDDLVWSIKRRLEQRIEFSKHLDSMTKEKDTAINNQKNTIKAQALRIYELSTAKSGLETTVQDLEDGRAGLLENARTSEARRIKSKTKARLAVQEAQHARMDVEQERDELQRQIDALKGEYEELLQNAASSIDEMQAKLVEAKKIDPRIHRQTVQQVHILHRERDEARDQRHTAIEEMKQARKGEALAHKLFQEERHELRAVFRDMNHSQEQSRLLRSKMAKSINAANSRIKSLEEQASLKLKASAEVERAMEGQLTRLRHQIIRIETQNQCAMLTAKAKTDGLEFEINALQTTNEQLSARLRALKSGKVTNSKTTKAPIVPKNVLDSFEMANIELQAQLNLLTTQLQQAEQAAKKSVSTQDDRMKVQVKELRKINAKLQEQLASANLSIKAIEEAGFVKLARQKADLESACQRLLTEKDRDATEDRLQLEQRFNKECARKEQELKDYCLEEWEKAKSYWGACAAEANKTIQSLRRELSERNLTIQRQRADLHTSNELQEYMRTRAESAEADARLHEEEAGEQRHRADQAELTISKYQGGAEIMREKIKTLNVESKRAKLLLQEVGEVPLDEAAMTVLNDMNNANYSIQSLKEMLESDNATLNKKELLETIEDDVEDIDELDVEWLPVLIREAHATNKKLHYMRESIHATPGTDIREEAQQHLLLQLVSCRGDIKRKADVQDNSSKCHSASDVKMSARVSGLTDPPPSQPVSHAPPFMPTPEFQRYLATPGPKGQSRVIPTYSSYMSAPGTPAKPNVASSTTRKSPFNPTSTYDPSRSPFNPSSSYVPLLNAPEYFIPESQGIYDDQSPTSGSSTKLDGQQPSRPRLIPKTRQPIPSKGASEPS